MAGATVISPELAEILLIQRRIGQQLPTLGRLQAIQARVGNYPPLVRAIAHCANAGAALHFESAPGVFPVPFIAPLISGDLQVAVAHVARLNRGSIQIPVKLRREHLLTHQLICGATGHGKTGALLQEWIGLLGLPNLSTALFAVEGSEMRVLEHLTDKRVVILNCAEEFSYNPLAPVEGIPIESAADDLVRALSVMWLGVASMSLLKPLVKSLMEDHVRGTPRTMADLCEAVRRSKYSSSRDAVLNKLAVLDTNLFRSKQPLNVPLLSKLHVVYLIEGLDSHVAAFFLNDVLAKTMRWKRVVLRAHFLNPDKQHINIFLADEAQRLFSAANAMSSHDLVFLPVITVGVQGRKLGIGLVLATAQPNLIPDSFLANAGVILAGRLGNEADSHTIRSILALNANQFEYYQTLMPKRTFLFRLAGGTLTFPVTIPHVQMSQTPFSTEDIQEWNAERMAEQPELASLFSNLREDGYSPMAKLDLPDDLRVFVKTVAENACPFTTLIKRLPWGPQKSYALRAQALRENMIQEGRATLGGRGFERICYITPLAEQRYRIRSCIACRGSWLHGYLMERIRTTKSQNGLILRKEVLLGNRIIDLLDEEGKSGFAIALGNKPQIEAAAILDNLGHLAQLYVIGNSKEHIKSVRKCLPDEVLPRVTFQLAINLVKQNGR